MTQYTPKESMLMRLQNSFRYHPPKDDQAERYEAIRSAALTFASFLVQATPESREQSLAITALEEVVMRANQAIAVNE